MILALSRFRVLHGREAAVREAFADRPRLVDGERGFLGMETFTNSADPATFYLVTRWTDSVSFRESRRTPPRVLGVDAHRRLPMARHRELRGRFSPRRRVPRGRPPPRR